MFTKIDEGVTAFKTAYMDFLKEKARRHNAPIRQVPGTDYCPTDDASQSTDNMFWEIEQGNRLRGMAKALGMTESEEKSARTEVETEFNESDAETGKRVPL